MSSAASDPVVSPNTGSKSKKTRKKKNIKAKSNGESIKPNGIRVEDQIPDDEAEVEEPEPPTPTEAPLSPRGVERSRRSSMTNGTVKRPTEPDDETSEGTNSDRINGVIRRQSEPSGIPVSQQITTDSFTQTSSAPSDMEVEALARERDSLREEIAQVRKSLENLQGKHEEENSGLRAQLADTQGGKEQVETQYRNLLGKVNTIRTQLGDRLKADAEDLSQARARIEELEEQNSNLREQNDTRAAELATVAEEAEQRSKDLSSLRNRTTLSQQNFTKEREDLLQRASVAKEDFEAAKQAMQDWEILAMEERSIRESLAERVAELEDQVTTHREGHEKAAADRDAQGLTVDGLQRALQEIQDARRRELREIVENSQTQVESLQKQLRDVESKASAATTELESTKQELERALPFEKEVKEKNIVIGKLRHEAVIRNDHLTKALRYLKKGKPEDTIDKQLVTNHFMHFIAIDRADPKKFQVLQIIASLLDWTDEQREHAGLARPGASNPNARIPVSPWHRTPSTPALTTEFFPDGGTRKESLADLWSDFLEQESQEGVKSPKSTTSSTVPSSLGGSKPP